MLTVSIAFMDGILSAFHGIVKKARGTGLYLSSLVFHLEWISHTEMIPILCSSQIFFYPLARAMVYNDYLYTITLCSQQLSQFNAITKGVTKLEAFVARNRHSLDNRNTVRL